MEKKITLQFDKLVVDLTGNTLGRTTFKHQIEPYFDAENVTVVEIPETIDDVGSSFVQGIYSFISEKYGKSRALEMLRLESENPEIMGKIHKSLETYGI